MKRRALFHCEFWGLCCFFITTDGFVWNMIAILLCWKNYVQFKSLNFQPTGFAENK